MQLAGAGGVGYIVSYLPATDQRPLSLAMGASALLAWVIFTVLLKEKKKAIPVKAHPSSLAEN